MGNVFEIEDDRLAQVLYDINDQLKKVSDNCTDTNKALVDKMLELTKLTQDVLCKVDILQRTVGEQDKEINGLTEKVANLEERCYEGIS